MSSSPIGAYDLTDEEQTKAYLNELEKTYSFECFSEKKPIGCCMLATFYDAIRRDFEKAAKLHKKNCDDSAYGESCFIYGQYSMIGRGGVPEDEKVSLEYFEKGCNADPPHAIACNNGGLLRTQDEFRNMPKAMSMLEKACNLGDSTACFNAASQYYGGNKISVNKDKAFDMSKKGCELGDWKSCKNLAFMYKRGEGTSQDDGLANHFMQRAKTLLDSEPDG